MGSSPITSIFRTLFQFTIPFHFSFIPQSLFFPVFRFSPCSLICIHGLVRGVGIINFKIFLIIYSKNIQTFRRIACYTKYIRNARMFNNYPSTLFENPKILKKIAPYHLVRSFFYVFHIYPLDMTGRNSCQVRLSAVSLISGSVLPEPPLISPRFHHQSSIRPFRSGALLLCSAPGHPQKSIPQASGQTA